jgi:hypothetical protein
MAIKQVFTSKFRNLILFGIATLMMVGCARDESPRAFTDFYQHEPGMTSRIEMLDGTTGQIRVLVEREHIDLYFNLMDSLTFTRKSDQQPRAGYLYWSDLYDGTRRLLRVTFGGEDAQIGNIWYDLDQSIHDDLQILYELGIPQPQ